MRSLLRRANEEVVQQPPVGEWHYESSMVERHPSAQPYLQLLESVGDGLATLDAALRITYLNPAAATIFGGSKANLTGCSIAKVLPESPGVTMASECRRVTSEQAPAHFECFFPANQKWIEVSAYPAADGGLSLHFHDITNRKWNESSLSRLASIVDSSEDAIMSADLNGVILTWNAAAERILGYAATEVIGKNIALIVPPEIIDEEVRILKHLKEGGSLRHFETTRVRKDGKRLNVSLTISPVRDANGVIVAASGIVRDITEPKLMEEQLRQTAKLESLGVLAGGIAHDFNNLLAGILGNASMASDILPQENPAHLMIAEVIKATERAANLTRQLLAYSGKGKYVIEPLDISGLCHDMIVLVKASVPKNVHVRLKLAPDLPPVIADATQLQQLVMNLLINAAEAVGDQPGVVDVATAERQVDDAYIAATPLSGQGVTADNYVLLEVRDNGCGMDAATVAKIFDPFFTTKFTGRGLGLSAALGIVRSHKGLIRVESSPGEGSVFTILLPAAKDRTVLPSAPEISADLRGEGVILLVDDEEAVRSMSAMALQRLGYRVITAADGAIALKIYARAASKIALVILDLSMPSMSGEECLRQLREIRPDAPILLSSGYSEADAMARIQDSGAIAFLQKPYTTRSLGDSVKTAITGRTRHQTKK
jgi:PAS domain S-box-containing protein